MEPTLLFLAFLGHMFLWIGLTNRLHALGIPRVFIKKITLGFLAIMIALPVVLAACCGPYLNLLLTTKSLPPAATAIRWYGWICWIIAGVTLVRWLYIHGPRKPNLVRVHRRKRFKLPPEITTPSHSTRHHRFSRLPHNEILQLELSEWTLELPRLNSALNGLTIAHWSDLHYTGRIGKSYFQEIVKIGNSLQPDLVTITGDLVDDNAYIEWIPETLGQLNAKYGVFFVLGNHDLRVDASRLRHTLAQCGLIDLGLRSHVLKVGNQSVVLVGNERPWFQSSETDEIPQPENDESCLRIALTHSPDQFGWARAQDMDLLLAGHTHGGQIRIPPLGAIFSPTFKGVRYASGVFYQKPTVLHVSRGISSDIPIRWNCPPELAMLTLQSSASHPTVEK